MAGEFAIAKLALNIARALFGGSPSSADRERLTDHNYRVLQAKIEEEELGRRLTSDEWFSRFGEGVASVSKRAVEERERALAWAQTEGGGSFTPGSKACRVRIIDLVAGAKLVQVSWRFSPSYPMNVPFDRDESDIGDYRALAEQLADKYGFDADEIISAVDTYFDRK